MNLLGFRVFVHGNCTFLGCRFVGGGGEVGAEGFLAAKHLMEQGGVCMGLLLRRHVALVRGDLWRVQSLREGAAEPTRVNVPRRPFRHGVLFDNLTCGHKAARNKAFARSSPKKPQLQTLHR